MDNRINRPAAQRILTAARIRSEAEESALCKGDAMEFDRITADKLEASAFEALLPGDIEHGMAGELVPVTRGQLVAAHYKDTMKTPSLVTAEASRTRLDLASAADVLETSLDLCDTIEASNAAERMLAGQMALLHKLAMKAGARAAESLERIEGVIDIKYREAGTIQANRLIGSMARASDTFQNGMMTLAKVRSGGKQNITVTHVQNTQVNSGGQAVVTGSPGGQGGVMVEGATNGKDR